MQPSPAEHGWYFKKGDDASERQGGPYTWVDLVTFARQGILTETDLVWHESMGQWVSPASIPGLTSPTAFQPAAPQPASAHRSRVGLFVGLGIAALLLVAATGFGVWWFLLRDGAAAGGPDLGVAETKSPDRTRLVTTSTWGDVPANQVCVLMAEGSNRRDAEVVADAIGGTVVGEVEYVGLYQIEYPGTKETDLASAIATAKSVKGVEGAFPNQQVHPDAEIWGVREDPYADPIYGGKAGAGFEAIGVSKAWTYIRGAGVELNKVHVGVVDSGLYLPGDGAENEFEGGEVNVEFPDPAAGEVTTPDMASGKAKTYGTHGTAVSSIIAADPDNGGLAGVAGPLGKRLTLSLINHASGSYGYSEATPDPDDPTKFVDVDGKTYSEGSLVALAKQVKAGATVVNCSWGNSNADPILVAAYNRFFTKMAADHPKVVFVCSGGNGGKVMDGSKRIPSGLKLPNMITVGWLNADGTTNEDADTASDNYEITLGAPGSGVVGIAAKGGAVEEAGSSLAAPEVASAVAMLKSLNANLSASEIKQILVETARPGVPNDSGDPTAQSKLVNKEQMGAGILAVDEAVLRVINDLRRAEGLAALTPEALEKMGAVDAVAITGKQGEYTVRGIVGATGKAGTKLAITVTGGDHAIGGGSTQAVSGASEATWKLSLPDGKGSVRVARQDNGAASVITIDQGALEGTWQWPEIIRIAGGKPQVTGGTVTVEIVSDGDGYALKEVNGEARVTLDGDQVKIVHDYPGLLPGEPGGRSVYTGTLSGDEIHGTCVDTYNEETRWDATRVK